MGRRTGGYCLHVCPSVLFSPHNERPIMLVITGLIYVESILSLLLVRIFSSTKPWKGEMEI